MKYTAKVIIGSLLLAATAGLAQANEQPLVSNNAFTSDNDSLVAYSDSSSVFYRSSFQIRNIKALIDANKTLQEKVTQQQERLEKQQEETKTLDKQFQELKKSVEEKDRANRETQATVQSLKDQISDLKRTLDEVNNKVK
ncbi:hypothetical protein [Erwinia sp. OPT-41]|jgi:septal ring factor EnvC (AmiA/AmiB activator)|uniref:Uncharacterized protein n=1 Tax=Erwinia plantamica TaxID=3237104 RepID=A0ABW7CMF3_9GAMM